MAEPDFEEFDNEGEDPSIERAATEAAVDCVMDTGDTGKELMRGLVRELLIRLKTPSIAAAMSASEFELIRKLLESNSVTLGSIRKGDFGKVAQKVAEEFPFPEEDN